MHEADEIGDVEIVGPEVTQTSDRLHLCNNQDDTALMKWVLMPSMTFPITGRRV